MNFWKHNTNVRCRWTRQHTKNEKEWTTNIRSKIVKSRAGQTYLLFDCIAVDFPEYNMVGLDSAFEKRLVLILTTASTRNPFTEILENWGDKSVRKLLKKEGKIISSDWRTDGRTWRKRRQSVEFRSYRLQNQCFRLLPSKYVTTKVTVSAGFLENWIFQVQALSDGTWSEVEILLHNF